MLTFSASSPYVPYPAVELEMAVAILAIDLKLERLLLANLSTRVDALLDSESDYFLDLDDAGNPC